MEQEGVRKFDIRHTYLIIEATIDTSPIDGVRSRLYSAGFVGVDDSGIGYGNISHRLSENEGKFLITGSQTGHKNPLTASDYSIVTSYDFNEFRLDSYGDTPPSSESLTHAALYEIFPPIHAVIHIHSAKHWEVMLANSEFLKTNHVEYGTREMVDEVKRLYSGVALEDSSVFAMSGHAGGIIAFGKTMDSAEAELDRLVERVG